MLNYRLFAACLLTMCVGVSHAQPDDSGDWVFSPDEDPAFERWKHQESGEFVWLKRESVTAKRPVTTIVIPPAKQQKTPKTPPPIAPKPKNTASKQSISQPITATPSNVSVDLQPVCAPERPSSGDPRLRRPGKRTPVLRYEAKNCDPTRLPPPTRQGIKDFAAVPDRWRIVGDLGYDENLWDPYSGFNILKGDRPVTGEWFFNALAVWDSIWEPRSFPVPVGNATTQNAGQVDLIGNGDQTVLASNLIAELVYYRGDTVFRPPDWEFRITPVFNINQVEFEERGLTNADPAVGRVRRDTHIGIQSAFVDYHIRNVSDRYDFDSVRFGIQPYNHDFRGFLFLDQPFGLRLFGTRDNNIFQYNLGLFRRLEKDTNSGLNDISMRMRDDDVFVANVFWQDLFKLGFTSQFSLLYNRNRERDRTLFDRNQFIARPSSLGTERARDYDVTYFGYSGDGHFGRLNLSVSTYGAFGRESNGTFNNQKSNIQAWFAAFEAGFDQDWVRYRFSFLYGSGDSNPYDNKAEGFDAVFENPIFAGADTSYWIRQTVPLIGGGRVTLSGRNGVLNSLRSSKEQGQSNFVNPGIILAGLGADLDLSTTTRLSFNANQLRFDDSTTVEVARNQSNIDNSIGTDVSAALIYRPFATQNVIFRLSGAILFPGKGFKQLFGDQDHHSVLANLLLVY